MQEMLIVPSSYFDYTSVMALHKHIGKHLGNYTYAIKGIKIAWEEELNFQIDVYAAAAALFLGWLLSVPAMQMLVLILAIGIVMAVELLNTALEEFCDMVKAEHDPHVGKIKDLAAGAVLLASSAAFVIGCMIFIPRLV